MADRLTTIDLIRHRYNALLTQADRGVAVQSLSRVANVSQTDFTGKEELDSQTIGYFISHLGEFDHILDPNIIEPDPDDFFQVPVKRNYRIIARTAAHLPLGEKGLSLLFDSRSTSQIRNAIGANIRISHLSTGHRLIPSKEAELLGLMELQTFPDLQFYPKNPVDLLDACFEDPSSFDKSGWSNSQSIWLDLECDNFEINVFSKDLRMESYGDGWSSKIDRALSVDDSKGRRLFSIEMLIRPQPQNIDPDNQRPFRKAFRLKRTCLEDNNQVTSSDSVILFHPEFKDLVAPPFREYVNNLHPKSLQMTDRFDLLRDVMRAFLASADRINDVKNIEKRLIGYQWRRMFDEDGLIEVLRGHCPSSGLELEEKIRSGLWID